MFFGDDSSSPYFCCFWLLRNKEYNDTATRTCKGDPKLIRYFGTYRLFEYSFTPLTVRDMLISIQESKLEVKSNQGFNGIK